MEITRLLTSHTDIGLFEKKNGTKTKTDHNFYLCHFAALFLTHQALIVFSLTSY